MKKKKKRKEKNEKERKKKFFFFFFIILVFFTLVLNLENNTNFPFFFVFNDLCIANIDMFHRMNLIRA